MKFFELSKSSAQSVSAQSTASRAQLELIENQPLIGPASGWRRAPMDPCRTR